MYETNWIQSITLILDINILGYFKNNFNALIISRSIPETKMTSVWVFLKTESIKEEKEKRRVWKRGGVKLWKQRRQSLFWGAIVFAIIINHLKLKQLSPDVEILKVFSSLFQLQQAWGDDWGGCLGNRQRSFALLQSQVGVSLSTITDNDDHYNHFSGARWR